MSHKLYLEKAILWAKRKGMQQIKANFEEYEMPSGFSKKGEEEPIIPDITGIQMGSKNYVEVVLKTEDVTRVVSKYKLLATMAAMKGGSLYLLAPKGHKSFADTVVKDHTLNAKVIYLK